VVPKQTPSGVLKQRRVLGRGEAVRSAQNTLVGLVEHGVP
jgi:hypothetical protein